jgi:hypothetical protein
VNHTITVEYSCRGCGLVDVAVDVPARGREDVVAWIKRIQSWIGSDHGRRSPRCSAKACDVKIPVPPGTEKIGGTVVN